MVWEMSFEEFQEGRIGLQISWISERNNFSNSESLRHCDFSHQVFAKSDLRFGRCHLKTFKMATMEAILDIGMEQL